MYSMCRRIEDHAYLVISCRSYSNGRNISIKSSKAASPGDPVPRVGHHGRAAASAGATGGRARHQEGVEELV